MGEALGGVRRKLSRAAEMAKGVQRLHASGIVDLGNLGVTLQTADLVGATTTQTHRGTRLAR